MIVISSGSQFLATSKEFLSTYIYMTLRSQPKKTRYVFEKHCFDGMTMTEVPTVHQLAGTYIFYMSLIGFDCVVSSKDG